MSQLLVGVIEKTFHIKNKEISKLNNFDIFMSIVVEVQVGHHVFLKTFPCRVTDVCRSKMGKHGASKTLIYGIDIFTNIEYEEIFFTSQQLMNFIP